uniref:Uncharacterized protein n=1 Tax=Candidatus Kentrum sp. FW TaxID=2126338 RepID=A0A450RXL5_9GAMM|nr:MAG: hypothetical protein BECKFW1821A_GA0114235_100552 [Candidatus Kentron sp. FW]
MYSKAAKRRVKPYRELSRPDSEVPISGGAVPNPDGEDPGLDDGLPNSGGRLPKFTAELLKSDVELPKSDAKVRKSDVEHRGLDAGLPKLDDTVPIRDEEDRKCTGRLPRPMALAANPAKQSGQDQSGTKQ